MGRRPLLILGAFAISLSLAFLAIFSRSLMVLLLTSFFCSFFYASLTVVVCVDCVARGATAGQSVFPGETQELLGRVEAAATTWTFHDRLF